MHGAGSSVVRGRYLQTLMRSGELVRDYDGS